MLEFCPLCNKNGQKKKITLSQINFQEAVWLCESPECPWPFGSEDFTFVSRKIGETWSSEWEITKSPSTSSKSSESFQISLGELGLDTPPVTPGSGNDIVHKDSVFSDNACLVTSLNSSTANCVQTKANFVSSITNCNKSRLSLASECGSIDSGEKCSDQGSLNNVKHSLKDNGKPSKISSGSSSDTDTNLESLDTSSHRFIDPRHSSEMLTESVFNVIKPQDDNLALHETTVKCKKWLSDNSNSTELGEYSPTSSECKKMGIEQRKDSLQIVTSKQKRNPIESLNRTKRLPKIKSIERTNVKLGVIGTSNQRNNSTISLDSTETVKKKANEMATCISYEHRSEACKTENQTLVIDGIFPISLSYQIPSFVKDSAVVQLTKNYGHNVKDELQVVDDPVVLVDVKREPVDFPETKCGEPTINVKTEIQRQSMERPLKRSVPKIARYQGFNFGTLRKKVKSNSEESVKLNLPNLPSPDNASTSSDITWTSETSCTTTSRVESKSELVTSSVDNCPKVAFSFATPSPSISSPDLKSISSFSPENDQVLDSSSNLDLVLDDLLLNESDGLPKDFGDDWIVSLFD